MSILQLSSSPTSIGSGPLSGLGGGQPSASEAATNTGAPPSSSVETQPTAPVPPPESTNKTDAKAAQRGDDSSVDNDARIQVAAAYSETSDASAATAAAAAIARENPPSDEATARAAAAAYQEQYRMDQMVARLTEEIEVADVRLGNTDTQSDATKGQGDPFGAAKPVTEAT